MRRAGPVIRVVGGASVFVVLGAVLALGLGWLLGMGPLTGPADEGVVDATASRGASTDGTGFTVWDRNEDGSPVRWDPCAPIDLVVTDTGAPDGWRDDLDRAVAVANEASGLELRVIGDVDETPTGDRSPYQPDRYGPRWAPVLVAWSAPREGLPLRDVDRGLGIPVAVGSDGDRVYVSGQVVLNVDRTDLQVGAADRRTAWGATILHELLHVLGLGHVDDPTELMATFPGEGPIELGPGDRTGLAAVGAGGGCLEVPDPRHVELTELTTDPHR